jgi:hypothetical protein
VHFCNFPPGKKERKMRRKRKKTHLIDPQRSLFSLSNFLLKRSCLFFSFGGERGMDGDGWEADEVRAGGLPDRYGTLPK